MPMASPMTLFAAVCKKPFQRCRLPDPRQARRNDQQFRAGKRRAEKFQRGAMAITGIEAVLVSGVLEGGVSPKCANTSCSLSLPAVPSLECTSAADCQLRLCPYGHEPGCNGCGVDERLTELELTFTEPYSFENSQGSFAVTRGVSGLGISSFNIQFADGGGTVRKRVTGVSFRCQDHPEVSSRFWVQAFSQRLFTCPQFLMPAFLPDHRAGPSTASALLRQFGTFLRLSGSAV